MGVGAAVAGATLASGYMGSKGAEKGGEQAAAGQVRAAEIGAESADKALAFQKQQYTQQRVDMQPWMQAGRRGLQGLEGMMGQQAPAFNYAGRDVSDLSQDPLYAQRIAEQTQALERSGAARGGLLGGGTISSLRDMTASEMGQAYGRNVSQEQSDYQRAVSDWDRQYGVRQDQMNQYASLAGVGQNQSQALGAAGQQFAANAGNIMSQAGASAQQSAANLGQIGAASTAGQYGAWGSAASGLASLAGNYQPTSNYSGLGGVYRGSQQDMMLAAQW